MKYRYAMPARVAAEVCLLLLPYGFFDPLGPRVWLLAAFAAAVLLCGIAAVGFDRAILRLLCCLPAALLLLAADRVGLLTVLGVSWLFAALRLTVGRFSVPYWAYRREFAVLTFAAVLASLLAAAGLGHPSLIGFAAASVLLGVYSLRVIRLGTPEEPRWGAYSALELALPFGAATGLSALLWLFFCGVYYVLEWIAGLFWVPSAPARQSSDPVAELPHLQYSIAPTPYGSGQAVYEELPPEPQTPAEPEGTDLVRLLPPYVWLIIILAVLLAAGLLIWLCLRRRKVARRAAGTGEDAETGRARRGRRGKTAALSPEKRIRAVYRSYLRFLQLRGQVIRGSDTSQDVLAASAVCGSGEDERELRAVYLAARYGDGAALAEADALRAEELFRNIRGEEQPAR